MPRACGAGSTAIRRLLAGSVLALVAPAALSGVLLERLVLGPALSKLAINYATLNLQASSVQIAAVILGLFLAGAVAVWWVSRGAMRESVITGLSA